MLFKRIGQLWGKTENGNKAYLMQEDNRDSLIPNYYMVEFEVPCKSIILFDGNSRPIQLQERVYPDYYSSYVY